MAASRNDVRVKEGKDLALDHAADTILHVHEPVVIGNSGPPRRLAASSVGHPLRGGLTTERPLLGYAFQADKPVEDTSAKISSCRVGGSERTRAYLLVISGMAASNGLSRSATIFSGKRFLKSSSTEAGLRI